MGRNSLVFQLCGTGFAGASPRLVLVVPWSGCAEREVQAIGSESKTLLPDLRTPAFRLLTVLPDSSLRVCGQGIPSQQSMGLRVAQEEFVLARPVGSLNLIHGPPGHIFREGRPICERQLHSTIYVVFVQQERKGIYLPFWRIAGLH